MLAARELKSTVFTYRHRNSFLQAEHRFRAAAGDGEFELPLHSKAETQAHRGEKGGVIFFQWKESHLVDIVMHILLGQ